MKKNKIILLILVTLLFSGCSVRYNLTINEDLSVSEKVTASENSNALKMKTNEQPKNAANSLYESYKVEGVKYTFSAVEKSGSTTGYTTATFKSLEEYEDKFKSDIIKNANISKKDNLVTLEFKQDVPLSEYSSKSLVYDSITASITVPYKVTENNADEVKGNTYTWYIKKDGKLKNIKITFNTKETEDSKVFNFGFFEININYSVLLAVGFAVIIIVIVLMVYSKNKKNNKF